MIFGLAAEITLISVLLAASGKRASATSAINCSSSLSQRSSPCSPCSANVGARLAVAEELGVASPTATAGGGEEPVAVTNELGEHFARVEILDYSALRHLDLSGDSPRWL